MYDRFLLFIIVQRVGVLWGTISIYLKSVSILRMTYFHGLLQKCFTFTLPNKKSDKFYKSVDIIPSKVSDFMNTVFVLYDHTVNCELYLNNNCFEN